MNLHDDNLTRNLNIAQEFYRKQERRQRIATGVSWGTLGFITGSAAVALAGRLVGAW